MKKSLILFVALVATALFNSVSVYAADFVADAIYVINADTVRCFRFTAKPVVSYDMDSVRVYAQGAQQLAIAMGRDVCVRLGVYQSDVAIDEIRVIDPARYGNRPGKYLYRGRIIIVEDKHHFDVNGRRL